MKLMGLNLGANRTPFQNINDEEEEIIKRELEAIDFFSRCNRL
jgi:N-acetylneuraminate lyase